MKLTKPQSWQFVSAENGLSALLYFTLAYLFVICTFGDFSLGGLVGRVLFSFIIIAGVIATFRQRWVWFLIIMLAAAGLAFTWFEHIHPARTVSILNALLGVTFLLLLFAILIVQVFQRGVVTGHKIRGAIVVYLLIGGIWSFFYYVAALTSSQAFNWPQGLSTSDWRAVQQVLTYFSFATLTTVGFGDVPPATPLTRTFAIFEALVGQIYLVVTLTRLVSLSVVCPSPPNKPD